MTASLMGQVFDLRLCIPFPLIFKLVSDRYCPLDQNVGAHCKTDGHRVLLSEFASEALALGRLGNGFQKFQAEYYSGCVGLIYKA
jgi:hypothetical protein